MRIKEGKSIIIDCQRSAVLEPLELVLLTLVFRRLLGTSSNVGITGREELEVRCWKDMPYFDSCGDVADRLGAVEVVLTKASAAKP